MSPMPALLYFSGSFAALMPPEWRGCQAGTEKQQQILPLSYVRRPCSAY